MKQFGVLLIATFIWLCFSCGGNQLKTDEKALGKQVFTEEERLAQEESERAQSEKQLADSIAKLPKGFQFKEERGINAENSPVILDITASRKTSANSPILLSSLFHKIDYIRLQNDPDSLAYRFNMNGNIIFGGKHIYLVHPDIGAIQYDLEGHFRQYVCKNRAPFAGVYMPTLEQLKLFKGTRSAYFTNHKLYYRYEDKETEKEMLIAFDDNSENISVQLQSNTETPEPLLGKGEPVLDLGGGRNNQFNPFPFFINDQTVAFSPKRKILERNLNIITLASPDKDTICQFPDYDQVENYTKTTYNSDDCVHYYFRNNFHIRPPFNDTIFQLVLPNKLIAKYTFDFGEMGIESSQQGVSGSNMENKLLFHSFLETNWHLFITYSKNGVGLYNARKGILKFSRLIYDKRNKTLLTVYTDHPPKFSENERALPQSSDTNIENDIDGLLFHWPVGTTSTGKPFSIYKSEDISLVKGKNVLPFQHLNNKEIIIAIYQ